MTTRKLMTTNEIAEKIGISPSTVLQRAKRLGIEPAEEPCKQHKFFASDLAKFGPRTGPGQPRKT